MPLSWNEIRNNALAFSREWADESSEDAEAKSFWDAFFVAFGVPRRRVASFEKPVKMSDGKGGYIDLLWKGVLLVEHKSRGKDLDRAFHQATDYFYGLKDRDLPRYILVSDFARFRLYDLEDDKIEEFNLKELHKKVGLFGFIAGYQAHRTSGPEEAANIKAAEQLGKLHDLLREVGYEGHPLEVLLVRLLFCLFADDTGIFEKNRFKEYLEQRTGEDGSDLGQHLTHFFQVLNTAQAKRQTNLDEQLAAFTYVNGRLFEESLPVPAFDRAMRETLLDACGLDWSRISPAIFGSLFQSIMNKEARRNLGAHYTRESNILKALRPLILDVLEAELAGIGTNSKRLLEFQKKLAGIRILDPACGCGNFLVIAYRELRRLELETLRLIYRDKESMDIDAKSLVFVDVDQFYGIEIEEFPAQIAQVALWLTDHQMNLQVSEEFGQYFARLPLVKSPNIVYGSEHGNALRIDWESVVKPSDLSYIVGNPPFVGKAYQSLAQKEDLARTFPDVKGAGVLDYVTCWYRRAVEFMQKNPSISAAFVSTNSVTQGEQVGILWPHLFERGVRINFAHRTFDWTSEGRGTAAVHCVIVGFALRDAQRKWLYDYETPRSDPHRTEVSNLNPYLVDAPTVFVTKRRIPVSQGAPQMAFGSMPNDGGFLLLSAEEKAKLSAEELRAAKWLRRLMGSDEFLYSTERWCLWLVAAEPAEIRAAPLVAQRVANVKKQREASSRAATKELANRPMLFGEIRQPMSRYLAVPEVSSEDRRFIPIGFLDPAVVATNKLYTIAGASDFHFGVVQSAMHMAWMRAVGGRLESRYQYSAGLVYNNFPWPDVTDKQRGAIETGAQGILKTRAEFPKSTLADLYDPVSMPPVLVKAHQVLDKAVDAAYGRKDFKSEAERVAFLFGLYQKITAPMDVASPLKKKRAGRKTSR